MKKFSLYLLLLLPLVGLIDAWLDIHRVIRVPSLKEWQQAAASVRAGYKKGDIIHFHPYWADQGQRFFQGMDVDVVQMMDLSELSTYKRVWVVATMSGLPFSIPTGFQPIMVKRQKRIQIFLLQPKRAKYITFDLLKGLKDAKVTRLYKRNPVVCKNFQDNRWYCGAKHPWQFVGERVRDLADGSPRRVIWAHPLNRGNKLQIQYPHLPKGNLLELHYGWSLKAIESDQGQPVHFQVYVDGKLKVSMVLKKDNHKWNRLLIPMDRASHSVKFLIWTGNYQTRQFCFKGWVFDQP